MQVGCQAADVKVVVGHNVQAFQEEGFCEERRGVLARLLSLIHCRRSGLGMSSTHGCGLLVKLVLTRFVESSTIRNA